MTNQCNRFLKSGNSMVGDESEEDYIKLELSDEGKMSLRVDLAYYLTTEQVEEYDGLENAAIYLESKLQQDDSGLFLIIPKQHSQNGDSVSLYYCDGEVQEA